MIEHPPSQNLELYAAGSLPAVDFLAIDDHLEGCENCRNRLAHLKNTELKVDNLLLQLQSTDLEHVDYENLQAYLDHRCDITDREIVESHLQDCPVCAQQVRDLQRMADTGQSFAQKMIFLWKSPEYAAPFRFVALAAAMASVALILILTMPSHDPDLQARLKEESEKNLRSQQELKLAKQRISQLENGITAEPLIAAIQDDTNTIGLTKNGDLRGANRFPERYRQMAKLALQNEKISIPDSVRRLQGDTLVLMGKNNIPGSLRPKDPVGRVVESNQPGFEWQPLAGAAQYRVDVYDNHFKPIISSGLLKEHSWTPPKPLARGITYIWKITALQNGKEIVAPVPPAPDARFKILEDEKITAVADARRSGSHLLVGLACADAGLVEEARSEFELLLRQNPDSFLVQKLLHSLP